MQFRYQRVADKYFIRRVQKRFLERGKQFTSIQKRVLTSLVSKLLLHNHITTSIVLPLRAYKMTKNKNIIMCIFFIDAFQLKMNRRSKITFIEISFIKIRNLSSTVQMNACVSSLQNVHHLKSPAVKFQLLQDNDFNFLCLLFL